MALPAVCAVYGTTGVMFHLSAWLSLASVCIANANPELVASVNTADSEKTTLDEAVQQENSLVQSDDFFAFYDVCAPHLDVIWLLVTSGIYAWGLAYIIYYELKVLTTPKM